MNYFRKRILMLIGMIILIIPISIFLSHKENTFTLPSIEDLEEVELLRVVDGDTLLVNYNNEETYVRLIGIDAPESVNPDESKNTPAGVEASNYLKNLLNGIDNVYLEFDVERTDNYGRTLAYVWIYSNDELVLLNKVLVAEGYAEIFFVYPNIKYKDCLMEDIDV